LFGITPVPHPSLRDTFSPRVKAFCGQLRHIFNLTNRLLPSVITCTQQLP